MVGNDGSGSMGVSSLNSSQTFTAGDMGKNLWIDEAPFPAPTFASNGILVDTGSGAMHCPGGGQFVNTATYPIHVYYRVTFINSAGTLEGNASVEGFASIPGSTSLMYCVKITSPTGAPTGAANYRVYFATDATPLPWVMRTYSVGQQILDPNGNIETVTVGGASGGSQPTWLGVGAITHDNVVRWLNQGPVVPGSGSGLEMLMSGTCGGTAGTLLGAGCEIDTLHAGTQSPPTPLVVNVGMITSVGPGNKLNWTGSPLPTAISGANFAWGHDDTTAITSAVTSLNNYVDSQSRVVGGTLFFPTSTGCYGIISNVAINATNSQFLGLTGEGSASSKMLGGPGTLPQQPASACIATIASSAGFTFSSDNGMLNAGPTVERLGFLDPFGVTATALAKDARNGAPLSIRP